MFVSSILDTEVIKTEITQAELPSAPQVVFLYPEGLKNGSSFLPGDYIYFTLTGDLSQLDALDDYYYVYYHWNEDTRPDSIDPLWSPVRLIDGIGLLNPIFSGKSTFDVWHNLTFKIHWRDPVSREQVILDTDVFRFYANSSLLNEPISCTPINYPNNSIIPRRAVLMFDTTGYILSDYSIGTVDRKPLAMPLNILYKWDCQIQWNNYSNWQLGAIGVDSRFNRIEVSVSPPAGEHNLYIQLKNLSTTKNYTYHYTMVDSYVNDVVCYYGGVTSDFYGVYWNSGDNVTFLLNDNAKHNNWRFNVTYNWRDGSGNRSLFLVEEKEITVMIPDFGSNGTGNRYLSIWINNTLENRIPFVFESIIPQIDLIYPLNDMAKSGMIPIIWSLKTQHRGFWDYSQYKFDLYFETATVTKTLIVSDYNPITEVTFNREHLSEYQTFCSLFNYYRTGIDPMVIGYEFDASILFDHVGEGSSIVEEENSIEVRFIIEETTTNTIWNLTDMSIKTKIIDINDDPDIFAHGLSEDYIIPLLFGPEKIQSATSDWITVYYSPPEDISSSEELSSTISAADTKDSEFISTVSDITIDKIPFSWILGIVALGLLIKKRQSR